MPGRNVQQKIITFATIFGATYVLLDLNGKVLRATYKFLNAAFDNKDGEEITQRKIEKEVRRRIGEILRRSEERRIQEEEEEEAAEKTD